MTGRSPQDAAAFKANLLEVAVIAPALVVALVAAIVTARMTASEGPLLQLAWMAGVTVPAYYATRGGLWLIVRNTQRRLHIEAGCVDCSTHS